MKTCNNEKEVQPDKVVSRQYQFKKPRLQSECSKLRPNFH